MSQTIGQRRAIYNGLRDRCTLSTAEFYNKVGRINPALPPRFNVVPCGNNEFSIVDRASDRTTAMCTGVNKAVRFARRCDESAAAQATPAPRPRGLAANMLRWTVVFCLTIVLFAFFGAYP